MDKRIQDLFIVEEEVDTQNAHALAERALKFGRLTKEGKVLIDDKSLSKGDQTKLSLVLRAIGHSLDETISHTVRPVELTTALGQRVEAVGSGLSRLATEGFAKKEGYGEYSVFPYRIEAFLAFLERRQSDPGVTTSSKKAGSRKSKNQPLRGGIGMHIQRLIDDGFFDSPRFVSEVIEKLKVENVFRDKRVVDTTIRDTFISKRRILQRIENKEGGKAKWRYVIRK